MTQSTKRFQGWIVTMFMALILTACGEAMSENPIQGNFAPDPNASVSSDSDQPSIGVGDGSGVKGQVIDREGNPIADAVVIPQSKDSPPQPIPEMAAITNPNGNYQWSLPPGRYTFTVHHDSYTTLTTEPVTVAPGKTTGLDMTLQKP